MKDGTHWKQSLQESVRAAVKRHTKPPPQHPYLSPFDTERWRLLLPEQRAEVLRQLLLAEKKLARAAKRCRVAKDIGNRAPHYGDAIVRHASNAGACRIAREMLEKIGGFP